MRITFRHATITGNLPVVEFFLRNELIPKQNIVGLAFRALLDLPVDSIDKSIADLISSRERSNSELSRHTRLNNLAQVSFLLTLPGDTIPGHEAVVRAYRYGISKIYAYRRIAARLVFMVTTARLTERVA